MSNTIDFCPTGYDYEQFQLNTLENENMKLKKQLEIATKALNRIREVCAYNLNQPSYIAQFSNRKVKVALKEMEGVK
jgi:hypothetical protein